MWSSISRFVSDWRLAIGALTVLTFTLCVAGCKSDEALVKVASNRRLSCNLLAESDVGWEAMAHLTKPPGRRMGSTIKSPIVLVRDEDLKSVEVVCRGRDAGLSINGVLVTEKYPAVLRVQLSAAQKDEGAAPRVVRVEVRKVGELAWTLLDWKGDRKLAELQKKLRQLIDEQEKGQTEEGQKRRDESGKE